MADVAQAVVLMPGGCVCSHLWINDKKTGQKVTMSDEILYLVTGNVEIAFSIFTKIHQKYAILYFLTLDYNLQTNSHLIHN